MLVEFPELIDSFIFLSFQAVASLISLVASVVALLKKFLP